MTLALPLSIRYREEPQHKPVAWLVPGDGPRLWFEEWQRWELPQDEWRLAFIPGWGVLTILPASQTPQVAPRGVPLGRIGPRLYLPLHAELLPQLTADELDSLLPTDFAAAVFHPGRGLLVVDMTDLRSVSDLIKPVPMRETDWSFAQPGEALNDRLLSVQPARQMSLQQIIEEGRGDIGSQASLIPGLPPRPKEPGNGLIDKAGRMAAQGAGFVALQIANWLSSIGSGGSARTGPAGGSHSLPTPGWLQALTKWARQRLNSVNQQLEELRNKEIRRLMHLLQNNPDEGLKYAIPFSSGEGNRGVAPAGGLLGSRDVNFNLSRLGGGGAADYWNLSAEYQAQLRQRYRELANRELQLGRHRRAAYIFAELLGDFDAAASALKAGEHWREAAVLYRDKLKRPLIAAECLEHGGLLHEAIALYEPLHEFEKIGDLYQRLDQRDDAVQAWQQAASLYEKNRDFFRAAKLCEEKITDAEQAAAVLQSSWLAGNLPRQTLEQQFALFARQAWHERTRERMKQLRQSHNTDISLATAASEALAAAAGTYPERAISAYAADSARVVVAAHLPNLDPTIRGRLIAALTSLVPADQVLQRDGQRYLREQPPPKPALATLPARIQSRRGPQLVREFQLTTATNWLSFAAQGEHFFAVGDWRSKLDVRMFDWFGNGYVSPAQRRLPAAPVEPPQIAVDVHGHGPLLISIGRGRQSFPCGIPGPDGPRRAILFDKGSTDDGLSYVGLSYALGRVILLEHSESQETVIAKAFAVGDEQRLGEIAATYSLHYTLPLDQPYPLHGRNDLLAIGLDDELLILRSEEHRQNVKLTEPIIGICGSAPFTRTRLAVVTQFATHLFWIQGTEISLSRPCAQELHEPLTCFSAGGRLVAIAENGGEVYETTGGALTLHSRLSMNQRPIAVMPTNEPDQFAVVLPGGIVRVYKLA